MGWIYLILLIAGGVFVYRTLVAIEKEIRAEIEVSGIDSSVCNKDEIPAVTTPTVVANDSIDQRISVTIANRPGILQTEMYVEFQDVDKKLIQKELLNLDRSGKISRLRSAKTFKLFIKD